MTVSANITNAIQTFFPIFPSSYLEKQVENSWSSERVLEVW